jgi:hypothetical protein
MDKKTTKETVPEPEHWHPAAVPVNLGTAAGPPAEEAEELPSKESPAKKK